MPNVRLQDCHDTVALFSRASGVVKKGKQQIGLVLDRRAQIRAIDEIKDKITSPDCFAMVRACASLCAAMCAAVRSCVHEVWQPWLARWSTF